MGKADMTRDYYADLEVQPTADLIEIKKQFKKLALKWHPDRNPGKEAEVNAKFQTIQSAHEILTDEAERRRYDAGRLRTTRFSGTTGGTRGNPYANAGAQWAPPPKPFGTPRARAAEQGTSGASRYQKFNTDGPFRSTPNKPPDQETRKNFYEGFERMKKTHPTGTFAGSSKTASPNRRPPPPPPPNVPEPRFTSQSGREESNKQRYPPGFPPQPKESKPGHDEWNSGERRSPRKNGFMPGNATFDEPAAPRTSSGYSNGRPDRPSTASSSKPPDPPPRPKGFERFQDPAGPIDGAARQSTPYATHGGEKTNPFESSNIHRSKTTRERPSVNVYRSSGSSSPNTRDKHRSASPPRSVRFGKQSSTFETNGESPPKRNYPHSKEEGSTQRSRTRFKASVVSDTSSEDEYSEPQSSPDRQPSGKNLPRRGASANNGTDNSNRPNVNNDKQRKANPADFRNMANSGDPLLNDLGSGPTGNQRGPDPTPQPMYEQASPRPVFSNVSRSHFTSSYHRFHSVSADKSSPEQPKPQPVKDRINGGNKFRVSPNESPPFAAENPASKPQSVRYSDATKIGSTATSPNSRADDLSNFEHRMMGGLHHTFSKAGAQGAADSNGTDRNMGFWRPQNVFGLSTQMGSGRSVSSPFNAHNTNLAGQVPRSPKRKVGDDYNSVNTSSESPRKRAASSNDGVQVSASNMTNQGNHRFPSAYRSQPSAIPPLFTSNVETFDTTFETGKWNGQFGADSFVNPSEFSNGPSRTRAGSRSGRKSPTKARSNTGRTRSASASLHSESAKPEQVGANNAPRDSPTKPFAPEEWADPALFNPSTFAPPTPQGPSRPPFSQRTPSRKGSRTNASRVSKTAGGKSAVVEGYSSDSDDEIEHPNPSASAGNSSSAQAAASSPNAMDIDSPSETTGGPTRQAGEVRNVPLEPSRPEWRSGATNGDRNTSNFASQTPGGMPNVKVHQDDDLKTNFEEFKNVDPFFQPAHGLDSFNDIKSTLPFESMPANNIPLNSDAPTRAGISIPVPPPPPKVPSRPLDGAGRMSMASWQSYALSFQTYYAEFDHYNRKMEAHIVARREQWDTLMNTSGWGWLESRSDKVFNEWATNSKHDTLVKEKWAEAAKNHDLAMGEFQTVRGSMCGKTEN